MLSRRNAFFIVAVMFTVVSLKSMRVALCSTDIIIDDNKYCKCNFWKLPELEDEVRNCKPLGAPAFNVISNSQLDVSDFMKNPENSGLNLPHFFSKITVLDSS